jgi:hypothetical protein
MCLIIQKPAERVISDDFLSNAWAQNGHGWGCFHLAHGTLNWARGMHLNELLTYNSRLPRSAEVYLHLRRATHGAVTHDMAHPHVVRDGLLLMHNGSISQLAPDDASRSDTAELARHLSDLLHGLSGSQVASLIRSSGFQTLMAPLLEGSAVVLMDQQGAVHLGKPWHAIRPSHWDASMTGILVSNLHTWRHRATVEATQGSAVGKEAAWA